MWWIGLGCRRGTSKQTIAAAISAVLQRYQLSENLIVGIATIDLKSNEPGLLEYCQVHRFELRCFSAAQLHAIAVPNPARVVAQIETLSVAEAAAICAAGSTNLTVPKQIFERAVTIAIAQIPLH
ncbi:MAG TPA: cobalamin biosynthesis protein [Leptolyngbya sp.]|jgi:cobalt-precorrin 5A hydrolase/precorrin-3B C17-methyltransferase|nr:cobalamin biosynthesis protein [Leptolyngbya sp.]